MMGGRPSKSVDDDEAQDGQRGALEEAEQQKATVGAGGTSEGAEHQEAAVEQSSARDRGEQFRLVLRALTTGAEIEVLDLYPDSTIAEVKAELQQSQGFPKAQQRLLLGHSILEDDETLMNLGPPAELSFVRLQWKMDEDKFGVGDLVQLHYDGNVVFDSLSETEEKWEDTMNDMLGRTFQVKALTAAGLCCLPSPKDRSLVAFPNSVLRRGEVLAKDDIVRMHESEQSVQHSFASVGYIWHPLMRGMLGKEFPVLEETSTGIVALPSPDGSQNGMWYFPVSVVSKVSSGFEEVVRRDCNEQSFS
mmetsp:Transcript_104324/g.183872  ORF Transcript_104324/g.183872 Transcript_104324/m.183872 type:complete len:305 (+) Transcript_104324:84-998(+)